MILLLSGAVFALCLIVGGSRAGALLPQLLALPLIALTLPVALARRDAFGRLGWILVAGLVAVPLLQVIPLPPSIWTALPGRAPVAEAFATEGAPAPWLAISLQPEETWRSAVALLPGLSLFLAAFSLGSRQRYQLVGVAVSVGFVSVLLAMLQVIGGPGNPLDFYDVAGKGVGFFVNNNHFATFLAMLIPVSVALLAEKNDEAVVQPWIVGGALVVMLLLGLALTGSRSALGLGILAVLASWLLIMRPVFGEGMKRRTALLAGAVAALVFAPIALGMGLMGILDRFGRSDLVDDARWTIFRVTWRAALDYLPFGSGLGTFQRVYQWHEPPNALMAEVINNAHNDWLELFLETGLFGAALMLLWIVWLASTAVVAFGRGGSPNARLAKAAVIALGLACLHSFWEYPLRATGLGAFFGLLCAVAAVRTQEAEAPSAVFAATGAKSRKRRRSVKKNALSRG